jgi:putative transposase
MSRKPRTESPGATHHVVAKGNAGQAIARDDIDRRAFVARLARAIELHGWSCLAYCLLNSHFHLVVEPPQPNLSVGMKWLKAGYAQDFNYRHGRKGHLFGGRFYSQVIERDTHLVAAIIYVILNPVRAGIVDRAEQWPWSSYRATIGLDPALSFLDAGNVLDFVDRRPDVARRMLAEAVDETARRHHDASPLRCPEAGVRPVGSDPSLLGHLYRRGQTPRV